jgi:hypothetical protein
MGPPGVDLYWLPLGAGGWFVRLNGKAYEALVAARDRRPRADLYHSALIVATPEAGFVVESAPIPDGNPAGRGVVCEGAVGHRSLGRFRVFRYEVRCWRDGVIPDIREAVDSPWRLTDDPAAGQRLLDLAPRLPSPVWGRDALGTGDMWNSNSVVSWLLTATGLDVDSIRPPAGGRAPGWAAGVVAARRDPP